MLRTLTKKQYMGVGYIHTFRNNETKEIVYVPCSEKEYLSMGGVGGEKNNPVLDGYTWMSSSGGTVMVDNPDTVLKEDEYVGVDGKYVAYTKDKNGVLIAVNVPLTDIVNDTIII